MNETTDTRELKKNLPAAPALPYTFKTSFAHYRRIFGLSRIIIVLAVSGILWYRFNLTTGVIFFLVVMALVAVIIYLLSSRSVSIDEKGIRYKNLLGKVTTTSFSEVDSAKVFFNYLDPAFGYTLRVIVGTKSGKALSISGTYWTTEDIVALISVLDSKKAKVQYYQNAVSSYAIAKEFPTLVYPHERHPFLVGGALLLLLLAAIVPLIIDKILEISR